MNRRHPYLSVMAYAIIAGFTPPPIRLILPLAYDAGQIASGVLASFKADVPGLSTATPVVRWSKV